MIPKDTTHETYSSHFLDYLKKFQISGSRKKDIEETFKYSTKEQPHVVELGCAGGRDAVEILKYTKNYIGIDYIQEFIDYAQEFIPRATFIVEDLETYSCPEDTDVVFAFASLLHSDKQELKEFFLRTHKNLSAGGLLRLSLKHKEAYTQAIERDTHGERVFFYYSQQDLKDITPQFKIIFIRKENHASKDWLEVLLQK